MSIPIYRHNQDHDDWEVASVYNSDDCDSMGRSECNESVRSSGSLNDPALHLQGQAYEGARPLVRYSVPQQPPQKFPLVPSTRPRRETRCVPPKQSNFIVPPPGVIFPSKDWTLSPPPPKDPYWPSTPSQIGSSSDRPVNAGLAEPPPSSLLLSPCSPPTSSITLVPSHTTSVTGTGTNVNAHASAMTPPPPRYHELAHNGISPRLAETGCQTRPGMGTSPRRRTGHDVLSTTSSSTYAPRSGHSQMEMTVGDGRLAGGGTNYRSGERYDLQPLPSGTKYEHEREHGLGCTGRARSSQTRERRPSIWRRFVRRFNPHVSVGQT